MYIGEYQPAENGDHAHQYAAAKCLKRGLCLEVCPNYVNGHTFFGAAFANDCYLVASRNAAEDGRVSSLYKTGCIQVALYVNTSLYAIALRFISLSSAEPIIRHAPAICIRLSCSFRRSDENSSADTGSI